MGKIDICVLAGVLGSISLPTAAIEGGCFCGKPNEDMRRATTEWRVWFLNCCVLVGSEAYDLVGDRARRAGVCNGDDD